MDNTLTVTELTSSIKKHLESRFPHLSVRGEISNLKEQASGHIYFTLKDQESQISAVLFRSSAGALARPPKTGDQVIATGELSVYPPRGNYQIIVRQLQFAGVGDLLMKLHERKQRLQALGWFDQEKKQALPPFPKRIGVVTSPTGAVIQDIIQVLSRRSSHFQLLINPVRVQGEGAAAEIARAIEEFNRFQLADLLIVGRGGGSVEDLWAFNEEIVAQAIHESKIPIISAVGHETDFTIADFVADVRAPTPSAAAEIALRESSLHLERLVQTKKNLTQHIQSLLMEQKLQLKQYKNHPLFASPFALLSKPLQLFDDYRADTDAAVRHLLAQKSLRLESLKKRFAVINPSLRIAALKQQLERLAAHLKSIDPKNLIQKGYSILFSEKNDSVILSCKELSVGELVRIQLADGNVLSRVVEVPSHEQ